MDAQDLLAVAYAVIADQAGIPADAYADDLPPDEAANWLRQIADGKRFGISAHPATYGEYALFE